VVFLGSSLLSEGTFSLQLIKKRDKSSFFLYPSSSSLYFRMTYPPLPVRVEARIIPPPFLSPHALAEGANNFPTDSCEPFPGKVPLVVVNPGSVIPPSLPPFDSSTVLLARFIHEALYLRFCPSFRPDCRERNLPGRFSVLFPV